jgi:hypothetical protein
MLNLLGPLQVHENALDHELCLPIGIGDALAHAAALGQRQPLRLPVDGGRAGEDELVDAELLAALGGEFFYIFSTSKLEKNLDQIQ